MEIFLLILAFVLIITGIIGSVVPVMPGPPIAFAGIISLHFAGPEYSVSTFLLVILGFITLVISVLDYMLPVWGTSYFGGSKYGNWGSTIGLIIGIFTSWLGPWGIILGPFLGAFIGELIYGQSTGAALKSAFGSFLGFLGGTFMKIMSSLIMLFVYLFYLIKGLI